MPVFVPVLGGLTKWAKWFTLLLHNLNRTKKLKQTSETTIYLQESGFVAKQRKPVLASGWWKTLTGHISVFGLKNGLTCKKSCFFLLVVVFILFVVCCLLVVGCCCWWFVCLLFNLLFLFLFFSTCCSCFFFCAAVAHLSHVVLFFFWGGGGLFWFCLSLFLFWFCFSSPLKKPLPLQLQSFSFFSTKTPFFKVLLFHFRFFCPSGSLFSCYVFLHLLLISHIFLVVLVFLMFFFVSPRFFFHILFFLCSLPIPFQIVLRFWSWSVFLATWFLMFLLFCSGLACSCLLFWKPSFFFGGGLQFFALFLLFCWRV